MKKVFALLSLLFLCLSFASCNKKDSKEDDLVNPLLGKWSRVVSSEVKDGIKLETVEFFTFDDKKHALQKSCEYANGNFYRELSSQTYTYLRHKNEVLMLKPLNSDNILKYPYTCTAKTLTLSTPSGIQVFTKN